MNNPHSPLWSIGIAVLEHSFTSIGNSGDPAATDRAARLPSGGEHVNKAA
jgi:hypothetical protein